MAKSWEPLGDRLLVRQHQKDTVTPGGIVLPDDAAEEKNTGTVTAVGCDIPREIINVGDVVIFANFVGTPVTVGGEILYLMKFENLLAKEVGD